MSEQLVDKKIANLHDLATQHAARISELEEQLCFANEEIEILKQEKMELIAEKTNLRELEALLAEGFKQELPDGTIKLVAKIRELEAENERLKADYKRVWAMLKRQNNRTFELFCERSALREEIERLRKAGDAIRQKLSDETLAEWDAAMNGDEHA